MLDPGNWATDITGEASLGILTVLLMNIMAFLLLQSLSAD
jgi:Mn2+/Fe2+ NRAMP family transporter